MQNSKTKFIVANDLHIGSKYQDNPNAYNELMALTHDGRTVLAGDIFDLACCPKSSVGELREMFLAQVRKFGSHYELGNHERQGEKIDPLVITLPDGKRVGFTHYDLIADYKKWSKYRKGELGSTSLGLLKTAVFDKLDWVKAHRPLPKGFLDRVEIYMDKYNLDFIIGGHFHVEAERRYSLSRNRVCICLPAHRINEVWV